MYATRGDVGALGPAGSRRLIAALRHGPARRTIAALRHGGVRRAFVGTRHLAFRLRWRIAHAIALVTAEREEARRQALHDIYVQHQAFLAGYARRGR